MAFAIFMVVINRRIAGAAVSTRLQGRRRASGS